MSEDPESHLAAQKEAKSSIDEPALNPSSDDTSDKQSFGAVGIKLTPSKNNLDAILKDMLGAEDQPVENDDVSNAQSDMSSLLPFGNVIPSDCEGSTIASGPLSLSGNDSSDLEAPDQRPNEVYIDPNATSTSYGSYFNRRRNCDQSLSSNESNSLSSILDSIGWTKRSQKVHHSRGLDKKKGMLHKFLASNTDSAHHEREASHRQKEVTRSSNRNAAGMVLFLLVCLSVLGKDEGNIVQDEAILAQAAVPDTPVETRTEGYTAGMGNSLINDGGIPKSDERPDHADKYYVNPQVYAPATLSVVADPSKKIDLTRETPLFWVVPKSGAKSVTNVLSTCHGLVLANEYGTAEHQSKEDLKVITKGKSKYVNVETYTWAGIESARRVGLVELKIADVITSPLFRESLELFDEMHPARAFTILRHPIDRAVGTFERLQRDRPGQNMTLLSYARSQHVENNYLVRYLSGKIEGQLSEENLFTAKETLKKFVIGLAGDLDNSVHRFERFFGYTGSAKCRQAMTKKKIVNRMKVKQGSEAWNLLLWQNKLDFELYKFAKELYRKQANDLHR